MGGKLSAWARMHLGQSRSAACAVCVWGWGGCSAERCKKNGFLKKKNTLNEWEKRYDERSVQGGRKGRWGEVGRVGGRVGASASERDPVKSETGVGSSRRCCCCHSQDPPSLRVLDVTGLAQILSVWTFATLHHTIDALKYIHARLTPMRWDFWMRKVQILQPSTAATDLHKLFLHILCNINLFVSL